MEAVKKQEDKLLAALCHISIIFSTMGVILPIVIYIHAREKSKPLAFQAMQAMLYHVASLIWTLVFTIVWTILICVFAFIFTAVAEAGANGEMAGGAAVVFMLVMIFLVLLLFAGIFVVYILGIAGTVQTMRGRMFRYPIIGKWLERWLAKDKD
ncbi:MAG: DUF4870 domain-containing protein [Candidatus Coatesbacteria bacterium]|nr:MAG: DUF4870 domain-containing protein [Candidatus Coatesbacteria bacterium]